MEEKIEYGQTSEADGCGLHGSLTKQENGTTYCKCIFKYTGPTCDQAPKCNQGCSPSGTIAVRSDCTCLCYLRYSGDRCDTGRCPAVEHAFCASANCNPSNDKLCPYKCGPCQINQKPSCEVDPECFRSTYGCIFLGKRPSREMCRTLGDNGRDRPDDVCRRRAIPLLNCNPCSQGRSEHALLNCPVLCGLCDEETTSSTLTSASSVVTTTPDSTTSKVTSASSVVTTPHDSITSIVNTGTTSTMQSTSILDVAGYMEMKYVAVIIVCLVVLAVITFAVGYILGLRKVFEKCFRRSNTKDERDSHNLHPVVTGQNGRNDPQTTTYENYVNPKNHAYEDFTDEERVGQAGDAEDHPYSDYTVEERLRQSMDEAYYQPSVKVDETSDGHYYTDLGIIPEMPHYQNVIE